MKFFQSLKQRLAHYNSPFNHWELDEPLNKESIKEICETEITDLTKMNINYDGTRAIDGGEGKFREGITKGGKAIKFRCFIEKNNDSVTDNMSELLTNNKYINYVQTILNIE